MRSNGLLSAVKWFHFLSIKEISFLILFIVCLVQVWIVIWQIYIKNTLSGLQSLKWWRNWKIEKFARSLHYKWLYCVLLLWIVGAYLQLVTVPPEKKWIFQNSDGLVLVGCVNRYRTELCFNMVSFQILLIVWIQSLKLNLDSLAQTKQVPMVLVDRATEKRLVLYS